MSNNTHKASIRSSRGQRVAVPTIESAVIGSPSKAETETATGDDSKQQPRSLQHRIYPRRFVRDYFPIIEAMTKTGSYPSRATVSSARVHSWPSTGIAKLTIGVCGVAVVIELVLLLLATNNPWSLGASDAVVMLYVLGPYAALGGVAWISRHDRKCAWIALSLTALLVVWGLWVFAAHTYHYLTDIEFRRVQHMGIFFVPACQWIACGLLFTLIVCYQRAVRRRTQKFCDVPDDPLGRPAEAPLPSTPASNSKST